jgi:phosphatidylglycerol lysyltransferase
VASEFASSRLLRIQRRRGRWFFAGLLVAIGAIDVVEAFVVHHTLRTRALESLLPTSITEGSRTAVVISGLALLLLARGMAKGKRVAWLLTCMVLGASAVLHLVKDLDFEQAALAAWVLLGLWWLRSDFQAASDSAALKRGVATLALGIGLAVLEAEVGSLLLHNQLSPQVGPLRSLEQLLYSWFGGSAYQPRTARAEWFLQSLPWVSGALMLIGLLQLLRPVTARVAAPAADRARAIALASRWAHNPVSWLALAPGNALVWAGEEAFVAHRVSGRVAVALGDPVGPRREHEMAIEAFVEHCERHDWNPAFYQVEVEAPYRRREQTVLPIGSDAVVEASNFSLGGKQRSDLRYAVRRCQREGVEFSFLPGDKTWELAAEELRELSVSWLAAARMPELGFSLGRLESLDDPAVTVATARTSDGRIAAFASWLPVPMRRGWCLDLMRRGPDAPYGVMEALIATSILEAGRRGLKDVSLGLVLDLESCGLRPPAGLRAVYGWLGGLDRNRSLWQFKEKFGPHWEPRYLAVPDPAALPAVLTALARVHMPALEPIRAVLAVVRHSLAHKLVTRSRRPARGQEQPPANHPRPGGHAPGVQAEVNRP